jgi:PAS domain S-box-containing protein
MLDPAILERALKREKKARKEAEAFLEAKSRELFEANQDLLQLAAKLQQQIDQTQTILRTAAEGILTFSEQGVIESFNKAAEEIFGLGLDEAIGAKLTELILVPDLFTDLSRLTDGQPMSFGLNRKLNGNHKIRGSFPIEMSVSAVELEGQKIFVGIVRDVSLRRALEQRLALAQKMESVGQLAAGVAHELNTPIQYVGDNADFLDNAFQQLEKLFSFLDDRFLSSDESEVSGLQETYSELSAEIQLGYLRTQIPEAIEQSIVGTQRVASIVGAMKEFSHPGKDQKVPCSLNRIIENALNISRNEWKYSAELNVELAGDLPEIMCLPGEINQVILNLIVNAAHAISDRGLECGKISVSSLRDTDHLVIAVEDNGSGIAESERHKIFDPFFTTKEVGRGTGQGLAIVYSIVVDRHQGQINFDSTLNEGTRFEVRLPLSPKEAEACN